MNRISRPIHILVVVLCATSLNHCTRAKRFQRQYLENLVNQTQPPMIDETYLIEPDLERLQMTKAYFSLHNPDVGDLIDPDQGAGSIQMMPAVIVVHYTAIPSLQETVDYFIPNRIAGNRGTVTSNGDLNVGVQFMVDRDGSIYRFYPETAMSRHVIGLNHVSIGIENVGEGDIGRAQLRGGPDHAEHLTLSQLEANVKLVHYLSQKYPSIQFVIAHSEYRDLEHPDHPGSHLFQEAVKGYRTEKIDPGKRFMKALRKRIARLKSPTQGQGN